MSVIALFHSALGIREGVTDAAARLRAAGHEVHVVDQYEGRVFDEYDEAMAFADGLGFPELMTRALDGVAHLADGFVPVGFSNGAGMATYVAVSRKVSAAVLFAGALPLHYIEAEAWPAGVPAQLHYTVDDPFKEDSSVTSVLRSVTEAGNVAEFFQYPGRGHLFTDATLPDEYDAASAEALWAHVLRFLGQLQPR